MSGGQNLNNGFSFEVNDPEMKSQLRFSLVYDEAVDVFCFTIKTYDHRSVGDDFSPWKPYHTNSETRYWISPDKAKIVMNEKFWDSVKETMTNIYKRRESENDFIDGSGI